MTNADVIRNMTDEQLHEFLSGWEFGDYEYAVTFCDLCMADRRKGGTGNTLGLDCDGCRKHWLLSDSEDVNGLNA